MELIPAAALLIVHEGKLLLAFSERKNAWYLPGGEIGAGETAEDTLVREIREELNCHLQSDKLGWFMELVAPAFGEQDDHYTRQQCFFYHGDLQPVASGEISALRFFTREGYLRERVQLIGVLMVLDELKKEGYL